MIDWRKRPVAFRVKWKDVWVLFNDEQEAQTFADARGIDYFGLYARSNNDGHSLMQIRNDSHSSGT